MLLLRNIFISLFVFFVAFSCNEKPKSAEEVLELYVSSINNCNCQQALEISTGEAYETVQYIIEDGCSKNNDEIISITCENTEDTTVCNLRVIRENKPFDKPLGKYTYNYTYSMIKVGGKWKVWDQWKSLNWPEEFSYSNSEMTNNLELNGSFEGFYNKFISDSIFQISRIKFPLAGTLSDYGRNIEWTKEKWPLMTWDYREKINNTNDSISIIETDTSFYYSTFCKDCGFSFWMEFEKSEGLWQLTSRQENNF